MDRQQVFIGAIPQDTDLLLSQKNAYIGLAKLAAAILGVSTLLNAFTCVPTSPASMSVNVTPGEIYSLQNIDNTAYGSLVADTTHSIVKQGVSLNNTTLALTAPGTSGNSWNILVEVGFSETDGGSTVLPYYNASSPSSPWSGPNNTGQSNNTIRFNGVTIQAKTGVQAPTGTQVTPSPDTGFVGAFVVTVANGQSTITSGNISTYTGAPFITETLTQKISQATADLRYPQITAVQSGQYVYGVDTSGVANTVTATLSPAITSYTAGLNVRIKIANTNTGASTINLNGVGAANIKLVNGSAIGTGDLVSSGVADLTYDGTNFQLKNPGAVDATSIQNNSFIYATDTGAANAYVVTLNPALPAYTAGLGLIVKIANTNTSGTCTINVNGLGTKSIKLGNGANVTIGDLSAGSLARLSYDGTNFQLLNPAMVVKRINRIVIASSQTYTPSPGLIAADVMIIGGGASGGSTAATSSAQGAAAGGGGGGETAWGKFTPQQIGASINVSIGAGGATPAAGNNSGNSGGTTSFGSLMTALGGSPGGGSVAISNNSVINSANGGAGGGIFSTGSGGDYRSAGSYGGPGFVWNLSSSAGILPMAGGGGGASISPPNPNSAFGYETTSAYGNAGGGVGVAASSAAASGWYGEGGACVILEYLNQ